MSIRNESPEARSHYEKLEEEYEFIRSAIMCGATSIEEVEEKFEKHKQVKNAGSVETPE